MMKLSVEFSGSDGVQFIRYWVLARMSYNVQTSWRVIVRIIHRDYCLKTSLMPSSYLIRILNDSILLCLRFIFCLGVIILKKVEF